MSLMFTLFASLILSLLSKVNVFAMIIMARTLVLILHLPSFLVLFPANSMIVFTYMIQIVMYDIVGFFWEWSKYSFWKFNESIDSPVSD